MNVVTRLRRSGVAAEIYPDERAPLRRQIQYADRKGIPVVAFVGPDELSREEVNLRTMATGQQVAVPLRQVGEALARLPAASSGE